MSKSNRNGEDLLSVLADMESALAGIRGKPKPQTEPVEESVTELAPAPALVAVPAQPKAPDASTARTRTDPFQAERTTYPDPPPVYQGAPRANGTTAAVLAAIAWGES